MANEKVQEKIAMPEGIHAELQAKTVTLKSAKGSVSKKFKAKNISFRLEGNALVIVALDEKKKTMVVVNTLKSHMRNMIEGLQKGYRYRLEVAYSHFPMTLAVKGNVVEINNFLGEKKPRKAKIVGSVKVEVKGKEVIVSGSSKEDVGQTAANLEQTSRVRGKDWRIFQDGVYLVETGSLHEK